MFAARGGAANVVGVDGSERIAAVRAEAGLAPPCVASRRPLLTLTVVGCFFR